MKHTGLLTIILFLFTFSIEAAGVVRCFPNQSEVRYEFRGTVKRSINKDGTPNYLFYELETGDKIEINGLIPCVFQSYSDETLAIQNNPKIKTRSFYQFLDALKTQFTQIRVKNEKVTAEEANQHRKFLMKEFSTIDQKGNSERVSHSSITKEEYKRFLFEMLDDDNLLKYLKYLEKTSD